MNVHGPWARYSHWLRLRWPDGTVEPGPRLRANGDTDVPGVTVAGDLLGRPLLRDALASGARAAARIAADPALRAVTVPAGTLDLVIVGAGVAGLAAALEARRLGLRFEIVEASTPLSTLASYPPGRVVLAGSSVATPEGTLRATAGTKEALLEELRGQVARAGLVPRIARAEGIARAAGHLQVILAGEAPLPARRVIVATGRAGCFRRLGVPGEELEHVFDRLHDADGHAGQRVLVVGGGERAAQSAIALAESGAEVTLAIRGAVLTRPRYATLSRLSDRLAGAPMRPWRQRVARALIPRRAPGPGTITLRLSTRVTEIRAGEAVLQQADGTTDAVPADVVFVMVGREAPAAFLRRSGIALTDHHRARDRAGLVLLVLACALMSDPRPVGAILAWWRRAGAGPGPLARGLAGAAGMPGRAAADPRTLSGTLALGATAPAFWWTLTLSVLVTAFGVRRIRRRRTPYVTAQTLTLMAVQALALFLIPEVLLPWLGHNDRLPQGILAALFPVGGVHGREYWRASGLVLAWPLQVGNVLTPTPLWAWLAIAIAQSCVLLPLGVLRFGAGFFCGWICPRGALAETLGDTRRERMPHGPRWNRLDLGGQLVLAVTVALLALRIAGWARPAGTPPDVLAATLAGVYRWTVDVLLAGALGYGLFFWASGRVWCRFLCPLGALVQVWARFSRFRIRAEKARCISCGRCTAICHMGVDVMGFARRGRALEDPRCVACSACVQDCPTGALSFGSLHGATAD